MQKDCGDDECTEDVKYTGPAPVIPPLPKAIREAGGGTAGNNPGAPSSYTLPNFSLTNLGGVKGRQAAGYIVPGAMPGTAMLYNWEGIAHDLDNFTQLYGSLGALTEQQAEALLKITPAQAGRVTKLPKQVVDDWGASKQNTEDVQLALHMVDLVTGGVADKTFTITPAEASEGDNPGKAGIMSTFQATQLKALADAYEAEAKGYVLYEGQASVNTIELSEEADHFDHLIIVGEYINGGSAAIKEVQSVRFYPNNEYRSFAMTAIEMVTGDSPSLKIMQDIWSLSPDGIDLDLIQGQTGTLNGTFEVTPETTSMFTITKVIGYGKVA